MWNSRWWEWCSCSYKTLSTTTTGSRWSVMLNLNIYSFLGYFMWICDYFNVILFANFASDGVHPKDGYKSFVDTWQQPSPLLVENDMWFLALKMINYCIINCKPCDKSIEGEREIMSEPDMGLLRATSLMSQEPWPWNCESPRKVYKGHPNTLPKSCSGVMDTQV